MDPRGLDAGAGGAPLTVDVSVVIPSRNEAGTIRQCLQALRRQDCGADRYEIILVDGASTDGTADLAKTDGVRILHDGRSGPSGARNLGIRNARGHIVAFTDADCVPAHDWLSCILRVFDERPSLGGVGGALRMLRGTRLGAIEDAHCQRLYRGFITSNVAYRADVLDQVGGFDERLLCGEDWDLAWRVQDAGYEVVHDPRPVVVHDPPEVHGSLWKFLEKERWYGHHDVPTYAVAMRRALRDPQAKGSRSVLPHVGRAAFGLACLATTAGGVAAGSPRVAMLGLAAAAAHAAHDAFGSCRAGALRLRDAPAAVALGAARHYWRAAGTLTGCVDLARSHAPAARRPPKTPARGARPARPGAGSARAARRRPSAP